MTSATFDDLVARVLDEWLEASPVTATSLGDHRFDHRLAESGRTHSPSTWPGWRPATTTRTGTRGWARTCSPASCASPSTPTIRRTWCWGTPTRSSPESPQRSRRSPRGSRARRRERARCARCWTGSPPTFYAISPTPEGWDDERIASFYREYNVHMMRNPTIHEARPGHVLQLAHDRRQDTPTAVRKVFWNGPFVEGWAVYAEELMASHGFGGDAVRMQQLKTALRMTINAILDVRVHTRGMTREEGMRLMLNRGYQEEGEAVGKWRRALLTSTQLSTYFVGYLAVRDLCADLRAAHPDWSLRHVHDALLAHGSPPARHLRPLLGL